MGYESGKGYASGKGAGRNGYRRDYRPNPERSAYADRGSAGSGAGYKYAADKYSENSTSKGSSSSQPPRDAEEEHSVGSQLQGMGQRLQSFQQDFTQQLHSISEKENEKFDLIFAILSELQSRQAQLEESVRSVKSQCDMQMGGQYQGGQFGAVGQQYGQMSGHMVPGSNLQPAQQFSSGMMQADGSQMFAAVPQVLVVQSPTNGGMQYAVPQMMQQQPAQGMQQQVAMNFPNSQGGSSQDVGNAPFANGPDASASGAQASPSHGGRGIVAEAVSTPVAESDAS